MSDINTTGQESGAVINITPLLQGLFGKSEPRKAINPIGAAEGSILNDQRLLEVQQRINASIAAGEEPSKADIKKSNTLLARKARLEKKFQKQLARSPSKFEQFGIFAGATLEQLKSLLLGTSQGLQLLQSITTPTAAPVFNPAHLPSISEVSTMPFVVTPAGSSGSGFGGFLDSVINIGQKIFAPPAQIQPFPTPSQQGGGAIPAGFSLIPSVGGTIGRALFPSLPAIGAGAVGGELADAFQNLFRSGGASSGSDNAAFTDAIPGACRAKQHVKVNPCTGAETWFVPRGKAVLFSGDLATCKRVARVNKRVQKAMPPKHHHHRKTRKR